MSDSHYLPASSSAATLVETASDSDAHSYPPSLSLSKHVPIPLSTTAHSEMDFSSYRRSPSWRNGESVDRGGARTPSPTPSERRALKQKGMRMVDMQAMKTVEYWRQPRHIVMAFLALFGGVIGILFIVYDKSIIRTLHPATKWMHDLPAGWLIPIAILFVISFPPLFGHEIIAVLCGIVWGVGEGFAIVAAGTILGELGNFYVFKYSFRAYAEKQEKEKIFYACLARVVREGGFKIALISRYSVIPGHITTAIYATCGLNVFIFLAAAILSLPKQIMLILLGVLADSGVAEDNAKPVPKYEKYLSGVSIALTTVLTLLAWFYLMREIERVKSQVIYERRKARQAPMSELPHDSVSMTTLSVHSGRELEEGPIL